jgi:hypothetical protein
MLSTFDPAAAACDKPAQACGQTVRSGRSARRHRPAGYVHRRSPAAAVASVAGAVPGAAGEVPAGPVFAGGQRVQARVEVPVPAVQVRRGQGVVDQQRLPGRDLPQLGDG